jgi:hypothetical protein
MTIDLIPGTGTNEDDKANDPGTDDKKVGPGTDETQGPNNESTTDFTE